MLFKRIPAIPFLLATILCIGAFTWGAFAAEPPAGAGWRAGAARVEITPQEPIWLAGYAGRDHAAEGTLHPIWVKALALEDASEQRAVLVTTDLVGLPLAMTRAVLAHAESVHGLPNSHVILCSSHTHTGPVTDNMLYEMYPLDDEQKARIERYSEELVNRLIGALDEALANLGPATLESGVGVTRFAVNRRNNNEALITETHDFSGPVDHSVPVLRVARLDGTVMAVVFGYACHATTLAFYQWSGDYPGFAQIELEKAHPGATAMFFAGCGADQNPLPRRTVELAHQYGQELAVAVDRVLAEPMKPLEPAFSAYYNEVELTMAPAPSREELAALAENAPDYRLRCLNQLIETLDAGQPLPSSYPYPIQLWRLGDQTLVALAGEVVVDYSVFLKRMLGNDTFVMAYAHHIPSYIPSERVLEEGGYEGADAQLYYGFAAPWASGIEERIMLGATEGAAALGLPVAPWKD
ncbi:MAG TPA: neutral/alkaline non-lysosomal ceramidase N-terminal domain-containing protein [Candidatus Hydrogenedentes bacterium]|nr:neutral/alkaline non-lysosomal ceramidase N-terminal domain-containing protein [Candidatus Hydrogenedentota bacterium]